MPVGSRLKRSDNFKSKDTTLTNKTNTNADHKEENKVKTENNPGLKYLAALKDKNANKKSIAASKSKSCYLNEFGDVYVYLEDCMITKIVKNEVTKKKDEKIVIDEELLKNNEKSITRQAKQLSKIALLKKESIIDKEVGKSGDSPKKLEKNIEKEEKNVKKEILKESPEKIMEIEVHHSIEEGVKRRGAPKRVPVAEIVKMTPPKSHALKKSVIIDLKDIEEEIKTPKTRGRPPKASDNQEKEEITKKIDNNTNIDDKEIDIFKKIGRRKTTVTETPFVVELESVVVEKPKIPGLVHLENLKNRKSMMIGGKSKAEVEEVKTTSKIPGLENTAELRRKSQIVKTDDEKSTKTTEKDSNLSKVTEKKRQKYAIDVIDSNEMEGIESAVEPTKNDERITCKSVLEVTSSISTKSPEKNSNLSKISGKTRSKSVLGFEETNQMEIEETVVKSSKKDESEKSSRKSISTPKTNDINPGLYAIADLKQRNSALEAGNVKKVGKTTKKTFGESSKIPGFSQIQEIRSRKSAFPTPKKSDELKSSSETSCSLLKSTSYPTKSFLETESLSVVEKKAAFSLTSESTVESQRPSLSSSSIFSTSNFDALRSQKKLFTQPPFETCGSSLFPPSQFSTPTSSLTSQKSSALPSDIFSTPQSSRIPSSFATPQSSRIPSSSFATPQSSLYPSSSMSTPTTYKSHTFSRPPMSSLYHPSPSSILRTSASCLKTPTHSSLARSATNKRSMSCLTNENEAIVAEPKLKMARTVNDNDEEMRSAVPSRRQSVTFSNRVEVKEIKGNSFTGDSAGSDHDDAVATDELRKQVEEQIAKTKQDLINKRKYRNLSISSSNIFSPRPTQVSHVAPVAPSVMSDLLISRRMAQIEATGAVTALQTPSQFNFNNPSLKIDGGLSILGGEQRSEANNELTNDISDDEMDDEERYKSNKCTIL